MNTDKRNSASLVQLGHPAPLGHHPMDAAHLTPVPMGRLALNVRRADLSLCKSS